MEMAKYTRMVCGCILGRSIVWCGIHGLVFGCSQINTRLQWSICDVGPSHWTGQWRSVFG